MSDLKPNLPGICIILPILNEADNITPLIDGICLHLQKYPFTICIIDDGSKDGTLEKIQELMKKYTDCIHLIQRVKTRRGCQRGSALFFGMKWALENTTHQIFIEIDGDLSHR
ncbi:MAG: glycosyltransferase, partial [Candidatus Calescibacterium sp.]|nr:glycosyltransferase [Candidatus Calescibacterium sp.]